MTNNNLNRTLLRMKRFICELRKYLLLHHLIKGTQPYYCLTIRLDHMGESFLFFSFFFFRVYQNSPSEHKITNVGSKNCHVTLWKENFPDTGDIKKLNCK